MRISKVRLSAVLAAVGLSAGLVLSLAASPALAGGKSSASTGVSGTCPNLRVTYTWANFKPAHGATLTARVGIQETDGSYYYSESLAVADSGQYSYTFTVGTGTWTGVGGLFTQRRGDVLAVKGSAEVSNTSTTCSA